MDRARVRHPSQGRGKALLWTSFTHSGHTYRSLKTYLDRLVAIGILTKINCSEWATPSFTITRKDGRIRFIPNFRRLNKQIKCTTYLLPHIKYVLNNPSNFTYAKTLDFIMGYYNIFLTYAAKKVCMITAPFGKYEYNRLPMGVCIFPDIFQERTSALMDNLEFFRFYLNDFLVIALGSL